MIHSTGKAYPHFKDRTVYSLDGLWGFDFYPDINEKTLRQKIEKRELKLASRMAVPAAFDALPAYAGKRGLAVYRTSFHSTPGKKLLVQFEAVSLACEVFLDGKWIGEHGCGFSGFSLQGPASDNATRELVVLVDNRYNFEKNPLHEQYFDFYQWGGLIRSVYAHELSGIWIESAQVRVVDLSKGEIEVDLKVSGASGNVSCSVGFDESAEKTFLASFENGMARLQLSVPNAKPWSPKNPFLHRLHIHVAGDDMIVRFGLRVVKAESGKILLNGKPLKLLGYNRHESHPQFGPALPYAQLLADLQLLRDLGCNFIRGCHYPQDQRFLDLCDELGFLVWEETLGWQQKEKHFSSKAYLEAHRQMVREMIQVSFNHPSVILWGFLNEGESHQKYSVEAYREAAAQIRSLDATRLVTYASNHPTDDLCYDFADVISHNIYPGWYGDMEVDDRLSLIRPRIEACIRHLDKVGQGGKPYILSEIGCEALYGWRDPMNGFFTEEFQAEYLRIVCEEVVGNERISGLAIWHFADARTYQGALAIGRPRTFNNKGTVDEYRRPKKSYSVVKEIFNRRTS